MPWRRPAESRLAAAGTAAVALVPLLMVAYDLWIAQAGSRAARLPLYTVVFAFWTFSVVLLLRRGKQFIVRLLYIHSQVLAITMVYPLAHPSPWFNPPGLLKLSIAGFYFLAPLTLHLHITFPVRLGAPRLRKWLLAGLYLAALVFALTWAFGPPQLQRLGEIYTLLVFTAAVATLVYTYFFRADPDSRRRLRVIWAGTLTGILPSNLLYFVPGLYSHPLLPVWAVSLLLLVTPASFMYAILRQSLFGIDRWLNRALVYIFLVAGIFLAYLGPLFFLYLVLPGDWLVQAMIATTMTILIGLNFGWLRTRIERLADRFFSGGWYDYAGVVDSISHALARSLERGEVVEVLTRRVPALMQLEEGRLFFGEPAGTPAQPGNPPNLSFHFDLQDGTPAQWWVSGHQEGVDFSAEDRRILTTLAQQAEIALNNVSLVEALRRQLEEIRLSREQLAQIQRQMLRSREDERARMARDLHDGPLQTLIGMNLQLGILLAGQPAEPGVPESLADMRLEVRGLLTELRQVCSELRPPLLDMLGLGAAIQTLAQDWSAQQGIPAQVELPASADWRRLPGEVAVNLYRVTQEALANVAHHAGAGQVRIQLSGEPECLLLAISDDGCGFDPQSVLARPAENGHFGLAGMRERVDLIGGVWRVQSAPGEGTMILVEWPRMHPQS